MACGSMEPQIANGCCTELLRFPLPFPRVVAFVVIGEFRNDRVEQILLIRNFLPELTDSFDFHSSSV